MRTKKKIVLLGDSAVGKTSLIRRYVFDQFEDSYISTIGSKVTMKDLIIQRPERSVDVKFMIWDIIGREGYHALHARTFVGTHGAILIADLTRKETLENLERYWIPFLVKIVEDVPLIFVCNKSDLEDEYEFDPDEIKDVAERYNGHVERFLPADLEPGYSTSAKTGSNVEKAFESLGHLMMCSKELVEPVKELYESLVATGIQRNLDKTTPIGTLDAIIVDFCEGFEDSRLAMLILRQEFARASININNPIKENILKVIEFLAEAENEFKDEKIVLKSFEKRMKWANEIVE